MDSINDLKWSDLISPTMTPDEYLEIYRDKIKKIYESYEPKLEILQKIKDLLISKQDKLKIVALGADWCPDCSRNIPGMIRLVKDINSKDIDLKILYGIMVNALHKPGEAIWHKKRSPPEATDPMVTTDPIWMAVNAGTANGPTISAIARMMIRVRPNAMMLTLSYS